MEHRGPLLGVTGQKVERNAGRIAHRLVEVPDEARNPVGEVLGEQRELAMIGLRMAAEAARVVKLVDAIGLVVSHRKRGYRLLENLAEDGHHAARVDSPAEEDAIGHLGHQMALTDLEQEAFQFFQHPRLVSGLFRVRQVPILPYRDPITLSRQGMAGL